MKKLVYRHLLPLLVVAVFCRCEKVIEAKDLPNQDPMLVLNSMLYTGEKVSADLSSSKSILSGKPYKLVTNADCDLFENDSWVERLKHDSLGHYSGNYLPLADRKYTFKVNADGYPGIEASTTMPATIDNVRIERYDTTGSYYFTYGNPGSGGYQQAGGTGRFKVWITDDVAKKNFYGLGLTVFLYDESGNRMNADFNTVLYRVNNGGNLEVSDEELVNGREVFLDVYAGFNYYGFSSGNYVHSVEILLKISNISEEVYQYKQTVNQQAAMGPNFFAEPVLAYNNVTNGMGLVGSTNSKGLIRLFKGKLKVQ